MPRCKYTTGNTFTVQTHIKTAGVGSEVSNFWMLHKILQEPTHTRRHLKALCLNFRLGGGAFKNCGFL